MQITNSMPTYSKICLSCLPAMFFHENYSPILLSSKNLPVLINTKYTWNYVITYAYKYYKKF